MQSKCPTDFAFTLAPYLNLLKACIHPVKQLAERIEGQSLDSLQTRVDDHFLSRAPVQAEALERQDKMGNWEPPMATMATVFPVTQCDP